MVKKKSQTEKMFDMLMKGIPLEKVRDAYPNRGATLTGAIQMFIEKASPQVKELQRKLGSLASLANTL